jgi:flagellar biosynthesis protein
VALRYQRPAGAAAAGGVPEVVARGRGAVAERILALAREHGVPVREDRDLVELLSACELGDEVPVEVWSAVAEVLAWVYELRRPEPGGER